MNSTRHRRYVNEREARDIRFLVLLGHSHGEIAERLGRNRKTVDRTIREKGLGAPERPLELAWLTLRHAYEELAEAMADGREWDVGKLTKLNSEMRLTEAAMWAAAGNAPKEGMGDAGEPDEAWENLGEAERLRRLAEFGSPSETETDAEPGDGDGGGVAGVERKSIHSARPRYTGSAGGGVADMVVHGRTWRWQDAGGGGMGAHGGAAGMPPGGAGGAGPVGCARGDDRGAERAAPY
ncbi:hypothetical protein [Hyphomonas oceanitis]|uniref:hypothetical protein n=1 Tax=Hyphomonas oceanitis TaxID=81033 RepID=UPI0030033B9D